MQVPVTRLVAVLLCLSVSPAFAQQAAPPSEADTDPVNLFGFTFNQGERYKFGGELVAGHHLVHEPDARRLLRGQVVAEEDQFLRLG